MMLTRLMQIPIAVGAAGLMALGLAGGLARMGLTAGPVDAAMLHGALMISGFFGTLIALERATANGHPLAFAAPAASLAGGILVAFGNALAGGIAFLIAGCALTLLTGFAFRRLPCLFTGLMLAGTLLWPLGTLHWLQSGDLAETTYVWLGFLILTIASERIELSRLSRQGPIAMALLLAVTGVLLVGLLRGDALTGGLVPSLGLAGLALWLASCDIARTTIRMKGLARYSAASLLLGYVWLLVASVSLLVAPPTTSTYGHDAAIHAIGIGFVLSMVFAHAPIILPAVAGAPVRYHPALYVPLATLQASVLLRVSGDLIAAPALPHLSAGFTLAALVFYVGVLLATALVPRAIGIEGRHVFAARKGLDR